MIVAPPEGAQAEIKYLDFPLTVPVLVHELPSLFAGKIHALLCRQWEKGRDWFDFDWYVSRKTPVNYVLLTDAINQAGPWQGQKIVATKEWLMTQLAARISAMDWDKQKADVERFLKDTDRDLISFWSASFFLERLKKYASKMS